MIVSDRLAPFHTDIEMLDAELDEPIPCQVLEGYPDGVPCELSAVARIMASCVVHGPDGPFFMCQRDLDLLRNDGLCCRDCVDELGVENTIKLERIC